MRPGRGARVRPDGDRRARGRRAADRHLRLPLRRRAGRAVRAASRPEVGRPARQVAASLGHRARPRPAVGVRLAGAQRRPLPLRPALRWERWHYGYTLNPRSTPDSARGAGCRGTAAPRCRRSCRPHTRGRSRVRRAAGTCRPHCSRPSSTPRAGSTRSRSVRRRARHRAVHARHGARLRAARSVRPRVGDPGAGSPDARPAAPVRHRAAGSRCLQRRRRSRRACGCIPPYAETRAYVARVLALMGEAGEVVPGDHGLEVRLVE